MPGHRRLWTAELSTPEPLASWLAAHGRAGPVRLHRRAVAAGRVPHRPRRHPGHGRDAQRRPADHRPEFCATCGRRGIDVATVVLHCGLSSPDRDEPPYAEWFAVPPSTLDAVDPAPTRVVAIGTTVVRALESAARTGRTEGWTDLVVSPGDRLSTVDGLLTGWHPPEASHLRMLAAVADETLLRESYAVAARAGLPVARVRRRAPDPALTGAPGAPRRGDRRGRAVAAWLVALADVRPTHSDSGASRRQDSRTRVSAVRVCSQPTGSQCRCPTSERCLSSSTRGWSGG